MIGTGYVGLVTGTALAAAGHDVICIDIDPVKIEQLNRGEVAIYEPGLEELIRENMEKKRLKFTCGAKQAIQDSSVIFIAVGTPPHEDGGTDLSFVFQAAHDIADALNGYKVVVNKSTVPVGAGMKVKEIIQQNKKKDVPFSVVSNPEFLKEGSAIQDIFEGDRIILGVEDKKAAAIMKTVYAPFDIPVYITDIASAEMIKYASNAFLATKISFINEIANLCEKVGADIDEVARGMGADKRIGMNFLKAGLGYGGSCLPKDVKSLTITAKDAGHDLILLDAVIRVNENQKELMVEKIANSVHGVEAPLIAVLGLAFKPNTDDVRQAPSLYIIEKLMAKGIRLKAYDPKAINNAREIQPDIEYCDDLYETCNGVDASVIVTEWDEFIHMDLSVLKRRMKTPIIIDGRNIFDAEDMIRLGFKYISVGRGRIGRQIERSNHRPGI
ncbi:MAG: UDP-glucose dehydrogenase family protein [Bacillota bacterium]